MKKLSLLFFVSLLVCSFTLSSCESARKRPIGWIKVGKVQELMEKTKDSDVFLESLALFLRRDKGGFYIMSTYDIDGLEAMKAKETPRGIVFYSPRTGSEFAQDGKVLKGPATVPLPYYNLRFDRGEYDGPVDTLYAQVGIEKPAEWRLAVK